ncbi:galactokinase gal [Phaffia rhodozyma]|uniref:Galactokinase n=1 Tax=Phaffia rhodozyma TaxID=264483 RepID=A0A0F7ST35_PHARH|nr:galactokinase gal [Phaffia rhodozyma]
MSSSQRPIPIYHTLQEIYPNSHLSQAKRWNSLIEKFEQIYGHKPTAICRAPGRVNLIGEHIDYAGFGVLPAAVEFDILIALATRTSRSKVCEDGEDEMIVAENMDERYKMQKFTPYKTEEGAWELGVDKVTGGWVNYVKAGFCGVLEQHIEDSAAHADLLVTGSVPDGAGLSSSAAMVVASTISFLFLNDAHERCNQGQLVDMAMRNERVVGVNSGGMDQAASVMGSVDSALYISFFPALEATQVPMPQSARFVISNTLETHNLFNSGKIHYNLRVVESSIAGLFFAKHLSLSISSPASAQSEPFRPTLRQLVQQYITERGADLSLEEAIRTILKHLDEALGLDGKAEIGWTWKEIKEHAKDKCGLDEEQFERVYGENWIEVEATHFALYKRTRHILTESLRVLLFKKTCNAFADPADSEEKEEKVLEKLAEIMNESQNSCRDDFDCSSSELNALQQICLAGGAIGSRLTGAGWGGCTVSLLPANLSIETFKTYLRQTYKGYKGLNDEAFDNAVLETSPGSGAGIYLVD